MSIMNAVAAVGADSPAKVVQVGGVDSAGDLRPLVVGADGALFVVGNLVRVSAEFTRPGDTAPYGAGDIVSNSTSATTLLTLTNALRVAGGSGYIVRASLTTDKKSITPRIRVHLFNASDPTVAADNANHKELYADASKRLGFFDLPTMATAADASSSDMSRAMDNTVRHAVVAAAGSRNLYALLETLDAFTPANGEKFTLTLFVDCN